MDGIKRSVKQMGAFQKFFFDYFVSICFVYTYFRDLCFRLIPNYHGRIRALWLKLQKAYGLTEAAPIVSVRQYRRSRQGTVGQILVPGAGYKIVSKSEKKLPPGYSGILCITGRAKDTIVLRSGENAEPVPIENKLKESHRILQCMVVGQDQKYLAALIVPMQDAIWLMRKKTIFPLWTTSCSCSSLRSTKSFPVT